MSDTIHVFPANDLIDHDTESDGCPCSPAIEAVPRDDGSFGWVATHHSLDGREFNEPDYHGPEMPKEPQ